MRQLGELEAVIMDRLWEWGRPALVREVLDDLRKDRPLAYTTVMTVMENLHRKPTMRWPADRDTGPLATALVVLAAAGPAPGLAAAATDAVRRIQRLLKPAELLSRVRRQLLRAGAAAGGRVHARSSDRPVPRNQPARTA